MPYSHRFRWPLLCLTLACIVLTGCEMFSKDDDDAATVGIWGPSRLPLRFSPGTPAR